LQGMAAWMKVNSEAIYSTRPWKVPGEGPVVLKAGSFSEGGETALTNRDFRFTTKGNVLYAAAMGWPDDGKLVVRTLGGSSAGIVGNATSVELLGHGPVPFTQTDNGLEAHMPANKPCDIAYVLKIHGLDLSASNPMPLKPEAIRPAADGSLTLPADLASLSGALQLQGGTVENIGYWNDARDSITWNVHFDNPGTYNVSIKASAQAPSLVTLQDGAGGTTMITIQNTGDWNTYQVNIGNTLTVAAAGDHTLILKPNSSVPWQPINVAYIALNPKSN
jgi:hypothetical protein